VFGVVVVALCALGASAMLNKHAGEKVIRVRVDSIDKYNKLDRFAEELLLDVWASNAIEQYVDVRIPSHYMPLFELLQLPYEVYIEDLETLITQDLARRNNYKANADFFEEYHTYDEMNTYWRELATRFPTLVTTVNIGTTEQGRAINGIRIRGRNNPTRGFFFNGGQHAREWITNPTVQGIATYLLENYNNNTEVTNFVDNIEFTVVAPLNPDGFAFTWSNDRLWRKNRQPNNGGCVGTDTNRNWGYKWASGGSSSQPCSDTYHGPSAMSSQEVKAVDAYLKARNAAGIRYHAYIDYHAYSQLFMSPYGADNTLPSDYNRHMTVLNDLRTAILGAGWNTRYDVGPVYSTIYQASGGSNDHTYELNDVLYAFAAEGRDTGRYGFLLPEDQIKPSITENIEGFKVICRAVLAV